MNIKLLPLFVLFCVGMKDLPERHVFVRFLRFLSNALNLSFQRFSHREPRQEYQENMTK